MTELGNELVNGILEAKVDSVNAKKPTSQSNRYIVLFLPAFFFSKVMISGILLKSQVSAGFDFNPWNIFWVN